MQGHATSESAVCPSHVLSGQGLTFQLQHAVPSPVAPATYPTATR